MEEEGELCWVKHEVCCGVLGTLQKCDHGGWESSQERVAIVEAGDDDTWTKICAASHVRKGWILWML